MQSDGLPVKHWLSNMDKREIAKAFPCKSCLYRICSRELRQQLKWEPHLSPLRVSERFIEKQTMQLLKVILTTSSSSEALIERLRREIEIP